MNSKKRLLSIVVILLGLIITAGSYAFWSWQSFVTKNVAFNTSKDLRNYINYTEGNSKFTGDFEVSSYYYEGMHSTIALYKTQEAANVSLVATIHMDVNKIGENMKNSNALKWAVTRGNSSSREVIAQGNFIGSNNGDLLTLVPSIEVTTTNTEYSVWIWLDRNANPSDSLSGETLDTNVWTEINQIEGMEDIFEITGTRVTHQNINATVVNSKSKVISYAIVSKGTTPSSWTTITPTNIYNLNTTVSETGEYDIYFKDEREITKHATVNVTSIVTAPPTCTFGSWNVTPIANNETSNIELTCTDSVSEITVNNLKPSDITLSNSNITISNINKTAITNGYKYTIAVKGTINEGTTTITLPQNKIKNSMALGNSEVTSSEITIVNTYTVRFHAQLPSEYQEVEYIRSSGTQYIDTGFIPNQDTSVELRFKALKAGNQDYFGTSTSSNGYSYGIYDGGSNVYDNYNDDINVHSGHISGTLLIKKNKNVTTVSGDYNFNYTHSSRTFTSAYSLYLFARHKSSGAYRPASMDLYEFKIWDGDTLVRDFIPCYRVSDNVIGLYDTVNNVFYPNKGTGSFNKGNNVVKSNNYYDQTFTYNVSQQLTPNTFTRNGYTFNGWNTKADGTGTLYNDEQSVINLTDKNNRVVDLYAQWTTNNYTVNFTSNNELCTLASSIYSNRAVGFEDDINVNNPTCLGFTFAGWTSSTINTSTAKSGTTADPTSSWNGTATTNTYFKNLTGSGTATLIATWTKSDNTKPTLTVGTSESGTTYSKSKTATITLSDDAMLRAGTYTIKYGWSTSALTCNDMTNTTSISVTNGETTKSTNVTISGETGAGKLYICNPNIIYDRVGNELAANTVISTNMYLDNTGPTGTMTLENIGGIKATLTVSDANSGVQTPYYYLYDTQPITCNDTTTGFTSQTDNPYVFTVPASGTYYVCAKVEDKVGNASYYTDSILVKAYLKALSGDNDAFKETDYKTNITDIYFVDNVSIPSEAVATYDLDDMNVGLIKGWIIPNTEEEGKYKLYIGSNDTIYGRNLSSLFKNMSGVKNISFDNFDTSEVTTMSSMFAACSNLTSLDLSSFNTSSATTMASMFNGCTNLTTINISSFNTSNVTTMESMFYNCKKITSLDLSNFSTSNVTTMRYMFRGCSALTSININNFNTSKVTNMSGMFQGCSNLTSLDLSHFDTSKVTDMGGAYYGDAGGIGMFNGCTNLRILNLSNWDTSKVTDMDSMFYNCTNLLVIYVSSNKWNTDKVSYSGNMFKGSTNLYGGNGTGYSANYINKARAVIDTDDTSGYLTEAPTTNVLEHGTNGGNTTKFLSTGIMKNQIKKITFTNSISGHTANGTDTWDVSYQKNGSVLAWVGSADENGRYEMTIGQNGGVVASNGYGLFSYLNNLTSFEGMEYFDTSNVTNMRQMFDGDSALTAIDLSHFNTSKVTNMRVMFRNCSSLTLLNLSNFNTSKVTNMGAMFDGDSSLTTLNVSSFNTSNVTAMDYMFQNCKNIPSLDLSNFNTSSVTNMESMFQGCSSLTSLDLSSLDTSSVTNMSNMFRSCSKLTNINYGNNFNTSNVTTMDSMFYYSGFTSLDLSNFDTSNLTNVHEIFRGCTKLITVDLSSWNTSKLTNTYDMFYYCPKLKTIYVSNLWNMDNVTSSKDMFGGGNSIVGGNGTTFNSSYKDKTYARIDNPPDEPGYLTYKAYNGS